MTKQKTPKKSSYEHCPNRQQGLPGFFDGIEDQVFRCKLDSGYTPRFSKTCYGECDYNGANFEHCPIYKKGGPLFSSSGYMGCDAGAIR